MDHTHCLSPARAREADAAVTSSSYARLFPDLPAFTADEAFLILEAAQAGLSRSIVPNNRGLRPDPLKFALFGPISEFSSESRVEV